MDFPVIDPVALDLGFIQIRWYALAYIAGILGGWRYAIWVVKRHPISFDTAKLEEFVTWATVGIVIGGRLGFVIFYRPFYYFGEAPLEIFQIWKGGMAFHGGMLGVLIAAILFCRKHDISVLKFGDAVCAAAPIGLFFGRIANFINGEIWGRPSDVPWAIIFPKAGPEPRHPAQLYEGAVEGLLLFLVLFYLVRFTRAKETPGLIAGIFFLGYGVGRFFVEFVRGIDPVLGLFINDTFSMGQFLCLPMIALGLYLIRSARRTGPTPA
ncbi:MAG: prolipoprotein diacylglyceryl transferase [Alphaproteobacteria bacterium]|nr:prolipoprotein diacylglyceryl transferase [Alphaproteobacteria bacterium]